jgi:hypothetical protein
MAMCSVEEIVHTHINRKKTNVSPYFQIQSCLLCFQWKTLKIGLVNKGLKDSSVPIYGVALFARDMLDKSSKIRQANIESASAID